MHNPNSAHKINLDINTLSKMYLVDHLSTTEIGKHFGLSFTCILSKLHQNGIPVRDSHYNEYKKNRINISKLPSIIKEARIINHQLMGNITCPICKIMRTLTLSTLRINEIVSRNGRCNSCAMKQRAINLDVTTIKNLYLDKEQTIKQISSLFNVSSHVIERHLINNGVTLRPKGYSNILKISNKGTLELPVLDDICRGTDIGLNDSTYYKYVTCPKCKKSRWQGVSHANRNKSVCKICAVSPMLNNKGTIDKPIINDIRRGNEIGKTGNFYKWVVCPECKHERWELKGHSRKLHLCIECGHRIFGLRNRGSNNRLWRGGFSRKDYPDDFNERLKEQIRKRDDYTCQLCGKPQNGTKLVVHHIDYKKTNIEPSNLISLCPPSNNKCHIITNTNREYWTNYFRQVLIDREIIN